MKGREREITFDTHVRNLLVERRTNYRCRISEPKQTAAKVDDRTAEIASKNLAAVTRRKAGRRSHLLLARTKERKKGKEVPLFNKKEKGSRDEEILELGILS